jgi:uncharacterized protein
MLSLNLAKIRTAQERFDKVYPPTALPPDEHYSIVEPIAVGFDIFKDKEIFHLRGRVATTLELPCSRCLEPFRWVVDEPFDLTYHPQSVNTGEGEVEIDDNDFGAAYYQNDEIDLEQLIRERIHMSLPMKPLCREECRGLCPQCGTNLNRDTCDCKPEWEDPRLAALKQLRKES